MSDQKCFCGAETARCHGTLRLKKAGGQKLICSHCRTYGGTLKAGHKIGNHCQALICAGSQKPLLACHQRPRLPGVAADNRCHCGGKAWVCNGRLKAAANGKTLLQCNRCGATLSASDGNRAGDRCLSIRCASSRQAVTECRKRAKPKKLPRRGWPGNRRICFL